MNSRCDSVLMVTVLNSFWAFTKETILFDSTVVPIFFIELSRGVASIYARRSVRTAEI